MYVLVMTPITPSTSAVSCVGGGSARDEAEEEEEDESEEKEPVRLLPMPVKGKPHSKSPPLTMLTPPPPPPPAGPPQGARAFPQPSVFTRLQAGLLVAPDEAPSIHGPARCC